MPAHPRIYHLTHVDNLERIVASGLRSDAQVVNEGGPTVAVGMSSIKRRRLEEIEVSCHRGTMVGQYVPFYYCPRSVMLFLLHKGNHPELTYKGGQGPIVHLELDLGSTVRWAGSNDLRWAFSLGNAGAFYAQFRSEPSQFGELNWDAIAETDWRDPTTKEGKQAEFLVEPSVPWDRIRRVGVHSRAMADRVKNVVPTDSDSPPIVVKPSWYY